MIGESWRTSKTHMSSMPAAGSGERPSAAEADETEPFAQATSQFAELMQRFIEEVGAARKDAQVAADSARTAHADAERIRLEAIKHRADAEAEAVRIIDGARAEAENIRADAEGIRQEAETRAAAADRLYRGIVDDLERAQEILGTAIDRVGADVGEPTTSEYGTVMPDAPGEPAAQS